MHKTTVKGIRMNYMKTMFLWGKMVGAWQFPVVQHTEIHSFNSELTSNNVLENRSQMLSVISLYLPRKYAHIFTFKVFCSFSKKKNILYSKFVCNFLSLKNIINT